MPNMLSNAYIDIIENIERLLPGWWWSISIKRTTAQETKVTFSFGPAAGQTVYPRLEEGIVEDIVTYRSFVLQEEVVTERPAEYASAIAAVLYSAVSGAIDELQAHLREVPNIPLAIFSNACHRKSIGSNYSASSKIITYPPRDSLGTEAHKDEFRTLFPTLFLLLTDSFSKSYTELYMGSCPLSVDISLRKDETSVDIDVSESDVFLSNVMQSIINEVIPLNT